MTRMASEESAIPRYDLSEDLKRVVRTAQGMASDVEDDSYGMTDMREAETEQQQRARHQRTYQARKKEDGKCARCTQPALPGQRRCAHHAALAREQQRAYTQDTKARKREKGECYQCSEPAVPNRRLCEFHAEANRLKAREAYYRRKAETAEAKG